MLANLAEIRESHEEGFTLIELLVVILIIGILAAVAVPMFLNNRKSGVDSTVQADVKNAATQVESWITKQGATSKPVASAGAIADIKVSDGTLMTINGSSFSYCVLGINAGGDVAKATGGDTIALATAKGYVYFSNASTEAGKIRQATTTDVTDCKALGTGTGNAAVAKS